MKNEERRMKNDMITGAEALMRALKNEGVTTIFGYPGGAIMPVFDALYDYTRGEKKTFQCLSVHEYPPSVGKVRNFSYIITQANFLVQYFGNKKYLLNTKKTLVLH